MAPWLGSAAVSSYKGMFFPHPHPSIDFCQASLCLWYSPAMPPRKRTKYDSWSEERKDQHNLWKRRDRARKAKAAAVLRATAGAAAGVTASVAAPEGGGLPAQPAVATGTAGCGCGSTLIIPPDAGGVAGGGAGNCLVPASVTAVGVAGGGGSTFPVPASVTDDGVAVGGGSTVPVPTSVAAGGISWRGYHPPPGRRSRP